LTSECFEKMALHAIEKLPPAYFDKKAVSRKPSFLVNHASHSSPRTRDLSACGFSRRRSSCG
jgi:hypothetical protein